MNKIKTTHVGSLPRSNELSDLLFKKDKKEKIDLDAFDTVVKNDVKKIVKKQIDIGIKTLIEHNKDEIFSVDSNLLQNAAFRIFKGDYVFQEDLSTNCGVVIAEAYDVHTLEDIKNLENKK